MNLENKLKYVCQDLDVPRSIPCGDEGYRMHSSRWTR